MTHKLSRAVELAAVIAFHYELARFLAHATQAGTRGEDAPAAGPPPAGPAPGVLPAPRGRAAAATLTPSG